MRNNYKWKICFAWKNEIISKNATRQKKHKTTKVLFEKQLMIPKQGQTCEIKMKKVSEV